MKWLEIAQVALFITALAAAPFALLLYLHLLGDWYCFVLDLARSAPVCTGQP